MAKGDQGAVDVDIDHVHGSFVEPLRPVDGCQVVDEVDASQGVMAPLHIRWVDHVAFNHRDIGVGFDSLEVGRRTAPKVVQDDDAMALSQQTANQSGPDEPRPAGDDDAHAHGWTRSTTSNSTPEAVRRNSTVSPVLTAMQGSASKP